MQQILDFAHNTLQGFSSGDSNSLLYVLSRQLSQVRTRADDVANWPNVRFTMVVYSLTSHLLSPCII